MVREGVGGKGKLNLTRKEAIEALKHINTSRVHPFLHWEEMAEVRDMAIAALRGPTREQVEKAWGEWIPVMESEITGFNPKFAGRDPICGYKCSRCKAEAVLDCVLSNFCPTCGVPMTAKAVDIIMQRLETLYGEP